MNSEKNLSVLKEGDICIIDELAVSGALRRRLSELGFIKGSEVQCLQRSFSGDPTAYYVKGAVIALRKEDAAKIKTL